MNENTHDQDNQNSQSFNNQSTQSFQASTPLQQSNNQPMSNDSKTLITILLLIFFYPIGIIVMLFLVKWPWWVKLLIILPVLLFLIILGGTIAFAVFYPKDQIIEPLCRESCMGDESCVQRCVINKLNPDEIYNNDYGIETDYEEDNFKESDKIVD